MVTIIYIRTSTEEQTPENQIADCKTLVDGPYNIIKEMQSAYKDKDRPLFEQLRKDIQSGKVSKVIVWDLDRIYRNRVKLKSFLEECKVYNCVVLSYRQKFLNEIQNLKLPEGLEFIRDMMYNILIDVLGWIAEDESRKKSERVKIAFKNSTKKWGRKPIPKVDKKIKELHDSGKSIREIASEVYYWDEARNKKYVSKSYVHKIIQRFRGLNS